MATSKARVFDVLENAGFPAFSVVLANPPIIVYQLGVDVQAATAFMESFDWSDEAELAWKVSKNPHKYAVKQQLAAAIADLEAYIALPTPTAAQVRTASQRMAQILKAVLLRVTDIE